MPIASATISSRRQRRCVASDTDIDTDIDINIDIHTASDTAGSDGAADPGPEKDRICHSKHRRLGKEIPEDEDERATVT